ncbi:class I SAM-dependent methyltransferase [bacterium]|nr:class I SAM-dependent methyltransferase [bacterium]
MSDSFDEKAITWDADPAKRERAAAVARGIRKVIGSRSLSRALEYGCGTGLLSFELLPLFSEVTLMDTSDGMLDALREKIGLAGVRNMRPVKLNLLSDPMPEETYTCIYNMMVLHHISDVATLIQKFYDLLEAGGILCVADLDEEDGSFHGDGFGGHRGFDRQALRAMAEKAGFGEVRFDDIFQMPRTVGDSVRMFSLFLMTAVKSV